MDVAILCDFLGKEEWNDGRLEERENERMREWKSGMLEEWNETYPSFRCGEVYVSG